MKSFFVECLVKQWRILRFSYSGFRWKLIESNTIGCTELCAIFVPFPFTNPNPLFGEKYISKFSHETVCNKKKNTRREENRNVAIFLLVKHKTVEKMKTKQCKWTNVTLFFWAFVCRYQIRIESRRESRRNKRVMMAQFKESARAHA